MLINMYFLWATVTRTINKVEVNFKSINELTRSIFRKNQETLKKNDEKCRKMLENVRKGFKQSYRNVKMNKNSG